MADVVAAARLDRLCFARGVAFPIATIARFLRHPGFFGWGVHCGMRLVAMVIAVVHRRSTATAEAEIVTLDVHPIWRRRGLGRELLRLAGAGAAARECAAVRLHVATDNPAALALYRGEGYCVTALVPDYYGPGRNALAMSHHCHSVTRKNMKTAHGAVHGGRHFGPGDEIERESP